ncbi:MAG: PQQ-like beta-propeller repeat protein [Calditrichaeota bacterium]|nr:PQQ-like beta-propeller repeat protein [Calditrichota bacterium]
MKLAIRMNKYKIFLLVLSLSTGCILSCSGLIKLKVSEEELSSDQEKWTTVFSSNNRHNSVDSDLIPPYRIAWRKGYKSVITDQPLAVADHLIFTTRNGNLAFLNISKGQMLGDGRIAPGFDHAPVIENSTLFYGASLGEKTLVALNMLNLKKIWETKLGHVYTSPVIWKENIYVGTNNNKIAAVNKNNGEKIWQFDAGASPVGIPAENEGRLFFSDIQGNLYCLDAESGKEIWRKTLETNVYSGPVIADGRLFIGTTAGTFFAFSADSGKFLWRTQTEGAIFGHASYRDGVVYFGNNAHAVHALRAEDGSKLWSFKTGGIVNTTPLAGREYIYVLSWDKKLYIISRLDGEEVYHMEFNKPFKSSPLIYRNKLIIHTANDDIICLESRE